MDLGTTLKNLRDNRGLRQIDLARALNISAQAISTYERNERQPSIELLIGMAQYFRVTTDYLLGIGSDGVDISDLSKKNQILAVNVIETIRSTQNNV